MFELQKELLEKISDFLKGKKLAYENVSFVYGGPSCGYGNGCMGSCSESCSGTCNDTCSGSCSTSCFASEKASGW